MYHARHSALRESREMMPSEGGCPTSGRFSQKWVFKNIQMYGDLARSPKCTAQNYFEASTAHFASELKNGFDPAGGSTWPVSEARNVTMCP